MPARRAVHADRNEFVSSSAASNFPAERSSISPPRARIAMTSSGAAGVSSSKIGATPAIAAMAIRASGMAARTAASAGSAMTASPSQFGARMTSREGCESI